MVWSFSRPCRARPIFHFDHFDGRADVRGAKDDADDSNRSFSATHDDPDAVDVHGHVLHHPCFERADSLYRDAKYNGCDPAVASESQFAIEGSFSVRGKKKSSTGSAVEVTSAGTR